MKLEEAKPGDPPLPLEIVQNGMKQRIVLAGEPACSSRFELTETLDNRIVADGARVVAGTRFPGFAAPDPALAAMLAHEMAHNILRHRAWLAEHGRSSANILQTERQADRLVPWLLANAGYDPAGAAPAITALAHEFPRGLFPPRTHDDWPVRSALLQREAIAARAALDATGHADWQARLRGVPADMGERPGMR